MNKFDYQNKINNHLGDENIYQKWQRISITSIQIKLNSSLKRLKTEKKLSRSQYLHLHSNATNIPRFYGLVKLHKTGFPMRPIVSFCGSPTDPHLLWLT